MMGTWFVKSAILTTLLAVQSTSANSSGVSLTWSPEVLMNGSPCLFQIRSERPLKSLSGKWQGRRVFFDFDERSETWYGFAGVDLDTFPGQYRLTLNALPVRGNPLPISHSIPVGYAAYPKIKLSVPNRYTEPDPGMLERIRRDQALKKQIFSRMGETRLWSGAFSPPIDNVTTGGFGTERTFNGRRQSVHRGLDFRADTGTPVMAMNSGEVVFTGDMFYEGGFVVLDHGQGLMTIYMHLSEFRVSPGEKVDKRQIIGLSGGTGRATAPHLHVGFRWQGIYVDPSIVFGLSLP